jgi:hypothetical protein
MFFLSILAFSRFLVSDASSVSKNLDSDMGLPAPADTSRDVLGPVGQLWIANNFIAPDGYDRS